MFTRRLLIAVAALVLVAGIPARSLIAKDADPKHDNRKERMEKDKWTNADRARDALDHLKTVREELENITNKKEEGDAGEALKLVKQSIEKVDSYLAAVDSEKKK